MIKFLVMDVDGTLTDGKIYMGESGEAFKAFDIKDGCGIKDLLPQYEIEPVIITARESEILEKRCCELGIKHLYQGIRNKKEKLDDILLNDYSGAYSLENCAYIGDDILDIQCMLPIKRAGGLIGCPADAVDQVKKLATFISNKNAGNGAVRQFIEYIVNCQSETNYVTDDGLKYKIEKYIDYIQSLDLATLPIGCYEINSDAYFLVQEYDTKQPSECLLESHKKYIDVQWIISGTEKIAIADTGGLTISKEYDEGKDVMFWSEPKQMMDVVLSDNSYIILYPNNAHKPSMAVGQQQKVRKVVIKIMCSKSADKY